MVLTWAVNMITSAPGRRYTQPTMKKNDQRDANTAGWL